jgi:competence protein ComEC
MKITMLIFISLFLLGCEQQVTCPACNCPQQQPIIQQPTEELLKAYFINVGQGDSELIKYKDIEFLIDCGKANQGLTVTNFLKEKGVAQLDYLLITHPDADHIGGCYDVLKNIPTHTIIMNGDAADTQAYRDVMSAVGTSQLITSQEGMRWNIGPATMTILQSEKDFTDANHATIITKLVLNNISMLFTGDCDKECETNLNNKDIDIDILKVTHHGTKYGTLSVFLYRSTPKTAIISVGNNNYGHPAWETLDRISQNGIQIFRTDMDGNIEVSTNGNSYEVKKNA